MLIALTAMTNSCLRLAVKLTNLLHWLKWMRSRTQFHINVDISLAGFVYILLRIIQQFYFHYWHYCTVPYNSTHKHLHSCVRSLHLCSCFKKLLSWLARWCFWTWTKWTQVHWTKFLFEMPELLHIQIFLQLVICRSGSS